MPTSTQGGKVICFLNVADPESWSFWVVATSAIDNELGDQKSIGIKQLDQLGNRIRWEEIRQALDNTKTG